jgi:hypothetical protein
MGHHSNCRKERKESCNRCRSEESHHRKEERDCGPKVEKRVIWEKRCEWVKKCEEDEGPCDEPGCREKEPCPPRPPFPTISTLTGTIPPNTCSSLGSLGNYGLPVCLSSLLGGFPSLTGVASVVISAPSLGTSFSLGPTGIIAGGSAVCAGSLSATVIVPPANLVPLGITGTGICTGIGAGPSTTVPLTVTVVTFAAVPNPYYSGV